MAFAAGARQNVRNRIPKAPQRFPVLPNQVNSRMVIARNADCRPAMS